MTRFALFAALLAASACNKSSATKPAPDTAPPAAQARAQAQPAGTVQVIVNGKAAGSWSAQQIAAAGTVSMNNQNGEQREGWPLKKVAQSLVGPSARVVALAAADERVAIDEKQWNDPQRTLILRLSHRGELKAHWVAGGSADEAFLKGVRRVEVVQ
jgi:hypothetical protein